MANGFGGFVFGAVDYFVFRCNKFMFFILFYFFPSLCVFSVWGFEFWNTSYPLDAASASKLLLKFKSLWFEI